VTVAEHRQPVPLALLSPQGKERACKRPRRPDANPLLLLRSGLVLSGLVVLAGCATSGPEPASLGAGARTIIVSVDTWHAVIALPQTGGDDARGDAPAGARFEEWGYAERGWYLEGRQGVTGAFRAMLWPSAGVVEVTTGDRLWAERTPDPPAETFVLPVSEAGYARLRKYLWTTVAASEPLAVRGPSRFYPARDDSHLFHNCHHYSARALREAGLAVDPALAFSRWSLVRQLRRVAVPGAGREQPRIAGQRWFIEGLGGGAFTDEAGPDSMLSTPLSGRPPGHRGAAPTPHSRRTRRSGCSQHARPPKM
jgi:hypothetical protein